MRARHVRASCVLAIAAPAGPAPRARRRSCQWYAHEMASAREVRDRTMCIVLLWTLASIVIKTASSCCKGRPSRVADEGRGHNVNNTRRTSAAPLAPHARPAPREGPPGPGLSPAAFAELKTVQLAATEADSELCSICFEALRPGETAVRLACLHEYHRHCLRDWLLRKAECPTCRAVVGPAKPTIQP